MNINVNSLIKLFTYYILISNAFQNAQCCLVHVKLCRQVEKINLLKVELGNFPVC